MVPNPKQTEQPQPLTEAQRKELQTAMLQGVEWGARISYIATAIVTSAAIIATTYYTRNPVLIGLSYMLSCDVVFGSSEEIQKNRALTLKELKEKIRRFLKIWIFPRETERILPSKIRDEAVDN